MKKLLQSDKCSDLIVSVLLTFIHLAGFSFSLAMWFDQLGGQSSCA